MTKFSSQEAPRTPNRRSNPRAASTWERASETPPGVSHGIYSSIACIACGGGENTSLMMSLPVVVRRRFQTAAAAAMDLLFPPRCISCNAELDEDHGGVMLCSDCRRRLPVIDWPACPQCAAPVPESNGILLPCNHCAGDKLRFERTIAFGNYEGLLRQLIMRMKTDRSELVARTLLEVAWAEVRETIGDLGVDVVTAVPMHPWRRWRRGTNPPATIARGLAERMGKPAAPAMLRLVRDVPPQVGLSRPARFRNVAGEMAVRRTYHLRDAHVLVVDDILTTGATCSEAARVLRRAGAKRVTIFVLARTPTGG